MVKLKGMGGETKTPPPPPPEKVECKYCEGKYSKSFVKTHEKRCIVNPDYTPPPKKINPLIQRELDRLGKELEAIRNKPQIQIAEITNDKLWEIIKQNHDVSGMRNLIDYIARTRTKFLTSDQILGLKDKRSGLTNALVKVFRIANGGN